MMRKVIGAVLAVVGLVLASAQLQAIWWPIAHSNSTVHMEGLSLLVLLYEIGPAVLVASLYIWAMGGGRSAPAASLIGAGLLCVLGLLLTAVGVGMNLNTYSPRPRAPNAVTFEMHYSWMGTYEWAAWPGFALLVAAVWLLRGARPR
jgi:hypothetical protein